MLVGLILAAFAQEQCEEPVGRERFRALVLDGKSAVDRGNIDLLGTVLREAERAIPCLDFSPEPRVWADYMVVVAVAAYAQGGDWQSPLAAALRIRPSIDRGVGRSHPIYDWEPPEESEGPPLDIGEFLFVDGRAVDRAPPATGWYLVQKTDGDYWETLLLRNEPVDPVWIDTPVARPPELLWRVRVGIQGAAQLTTQSIFGTREGLSSVDQHMLRVTRDDGVPWPYVRPTWGGFLDGQATYEHLGIRVVVSGLGGAQAPLLRWGRAAVVYDRQRYTFGAGVMLHDTFFHTLPSARDPEQAGLRLGGVIEDTAVGVTPYAHVELTVRSGLRFVRSEAGVVFGLTSRLGTVTLMGQADFSVLFPRLSIFGATPGLGGRTGFARETFRHADQVGRVFGDSTTMYASSHLVFSFGSN